MDGQSLAKLFLDCEVFLPTAFGKFVSPGEWMFIIPAGPRREILTRYHPFENSEEYSLSVLWQSAQHQENGKTHDELREIVGERFKDEMDIIYMED